MKASLREWMEARGWGYYVGRGANRLQGDVVLFSPLLYCASFRAEWAAGKKATLAIARITVGGGNDLCLALGVPSIGYVGLGISGVLTILRRLGWMRDERETSIVYDGETAYLTLSLHASPDWFQRRRWSLNLRDWWYGQAVYTELEIVPKRAITLTLPEKDYPGTARVYESIWTRPRGPIERVRRVDLDVPEGVPGPGKGENAWDCGDERHYGITCPARSTQEAVDRFVTDILQTRKQRGDIAWSPTES